MILTTIENVIFNSYIGVPLMQQQFGYWLQLQRSPLKWPLSIFEFLDTGFSLPYQVLILIIFVGLNIMGHFTNPYVPTAA
jgi:hypothetical protein